MDLFVLPGRPVELLTDRPLEVPHAAVALAGAVVVILGPLDLLPAAGIDLPAEGGVLQPPGLIAAGEVLVAERFGGRAAAAGQAPPDLGDPVVQRVAGDLGDLATGGLVPGDQPRRIGNLVEVVEGVLTAGGTPQPKQPAGRIVDQGRLRSVPSGVAPRAVGIEP